MIIEMTPQEYRALDVFIAEHVMKFQRVDLFGQIAIQQNITSTDFFIFNNAARKAPNYSTSIADAWDVIEKLLKMGWQSKLVSFLKGYSIEIKTENNLAYFVEAKTAPLAICLAAKKAVETKRVTTMKFKPEDFLFNDVTVHRNDLSYADKMCELANAKLEEFLKNQVVQIDSANWYKRDGEGWRKMTAEEQLEYSK